MEINACQIQIVRQIQKKPPKNIAQLCELCVCVNLKYKLLRQVDFPLGGSEYQSISKHYTLHYLPSPQLFHLKLFYLCLMRVGHQPNKIQLFSSMSHISPETFSCCEPLIDSFVLPAICNSLSLQPVKGHIAISERLLILHLLSD